MFAVARLNVNGGLDNSFGTGGLTTTNIGPGYDEPSEIALQTVTVDGKTKTYAVVAGYAYSSVDDFIGPGTTKGALVRYNLDDQVLPGDPAPGSLDGSFGAGGIVQMSGGAAWNYHFREMAVQSNGSIVVTNDLQEEGPNEQNYLALARFSPTGQLDSTFGPGIATSIMGGLGDYSHEYYAHKLILDGNNILLSGALRTYTPSFSTQSFVARFMNDGTPDPSFGSVGSGSVFFHMNDKPSTSDEGLGNMTIQPDGKIVAVGAVHSGTASPNGWAVIRLTADDPITEGLANNSEPTSYDLALAYLLSDPDLFSDSDELTLEPAGASDSYAPLA